MLRCCLHSSDLSACIQFYIKLSRKKRYDPIAFLVASKLLEWNDGAGMDEMSYEARKWWADIEARAVKASRGKMSTIRDMNTKKSTVVRGALRGVAATGAGST